MVHSLPEKLKFLFEPADYKVAYGGRGAAKTETIAAILVLLGATKPLRIGCFREYQNSIKQSSYETLSQKIAELGLEGFYDVQGTGIFGRKGTTAEGTEFFFMGLRHNIMSIKSIAKIDIAWVEEAVTVSKASWDILLPTVRRDPPHGPFGKGSEVWVSFNPELESDETYVRFVKYPPPNTVVVLVNYHDNKWFPERLDLLRKADLLRDPIGYRTVWEGECRQTLSGAIYANEITMAQQEGRICKISYDKSRPVDTYWDLGKHDQTAIWFVQQVGMDYNLIDFHQESQKTIPHFIDLMNRRGYNYGINYLPHDGVRTDVRSDRSVETMLRSAGFRVRVVPRVSKKAISIQAGRVLFDNCYFDRDKTVDGLQALRRYRYDIDKNGQLMKEPLHDVNSDAADAFQQIGLVAKPESTKKKREFVDLNEILPFDVPNSQGWMA